MDVFIGSISLPVVVSRNLLKRTSRRGEEDLWASCEWSRAGGGAIHVGPLAIRTWITGEPLVLARSGRLSSGMNRNRVNRQSTRRGMRVVSAVAFLSVPVFAFSEFVLPGDAASAASKATTSLSPSTCPAQRGTEPEGAGKAAGTTGARARKLPTGKSHPMGTPPVGAAGKGATGHGKPGKMKGVGSCSSVAPSGSRTAA
jgi:hypothetical protein